MNTKIKLSILYSMAISSLFFCLSGCSKMNDTYYDYIKNGAYVYAGKVESLQAMGGKNRIKLSWQLVSDPDITQCKVFWMHNGMPDSTTIAVKRTTGVDTIQTVINNLDENTYTFQVYTYDDQGHSSVASTIIGEVYGDRYINNISNRQIGGGDFVDGILRLDWNSSPDTINVNTMIKYINSLNEEALLYLPRDSSSLLVPDYQFGTTIYFKSSYIPYKNAIDTFWASYSDSLIITP